MEGQHTAHCTLDACSKTVASFYATLQHAVLPVIQQCQVDAVANWCLQVMVLEAAPAAATGATGKSWAWLNANAKKPLHYRGEQEPVCVYLASRQLG
jgi:hypothetical protein